MLNRRRRGGPQPELGVRANLGQLALLVGVNAMVGGFLGQERTVLPLLATRAFGIQELRAALTFIVVFGAAKAVTNLIAGALADRFGRKPVLVAGWLVGLPVPPLLIWAPTWGWVVAANVLLGVNQGLAWSATVSMKLDLVGPKGRGLATGANEAAGYLGLSIAALFTGVIAARWGLRPAPFFFGLACAGLALGSSVLWVRETHDHALLEADAHPAPEPSLGVTWLHGSLRDPVLVAAAQAGAASNLNDAVSWGLFPLLFARTGMSVAAIGVLVATYPAVWGVGQLITGPLSDRLGRRGFVVGGMWLQAIGLAAVAGGHGFVWWLLATSLLGMGTAMAYPTLIAVVGDVAHPARRASALGIYRFWRDIGFAVGGVLGGLAADAVGIPGAIWVAAAITFVSGLGVAVRLRETARLPGSH